MPSCPQFSRVDILELKSQIFKKLGRQKAEKYFHSLKRLLNLKISKLEFNKLCYSIIGRENLALHNLFIRSILRNACLTNGRPSKETSMGHSPITKFSNGHFGDTVPMSPRKGRFTNSWDHKYRDRPSPLGPYGKMPTENLQKLADSCDLQMSREQQSAPELISIGSKALLELASVEDGEEVEQERGSPSVQSRSPVRAPLGVLMNVSGLPRTALHSGSAACISNTPESCFNSSELPDTRSLMKRLERKLEVEGLGLSVDGANLLNNGLDAFLKRLIKPCMELARARCTKKLMNRVNGIPSMYGVWQDTHVQRSDQCTASLLDFRVAMELNPQLLGEGWPVQLEKICFRATEE